MSRRGPDRALRRAVADLGRLHPDDAGAVLDALGPGEKERVDALVAELSGAPAEAQAPAEDEPAWIYDGVSPWLLVRIDPNAKAGRAGREFVLMTDAARDALAGAAAPCRTQGAGPGGGAGASLLGRAWQALTGALA